MSYSPVNLAMFIAAYSGAMAGMAASNRIPSTGFDGVAQIAGAFAEEVDTLWNSATASDLQVTTMRMACEAVWQNRAPQTYMTGVLTPGSYSPLASAVILLVNTSEDWFTAEGIDPNLPATGASPFAPTTTVTVDPYTATTGGTFLVNPATLANPSIRLPTGQSAGTLIWIRSTSGVPFGSIELLRQGAELIDGASTRTYPLAIAALVEFDGVSNWRTVWAIGGAIREGTPGTQEVWSLSADGVSAPEFNSAGGLTWGGSATPTWNFSQTAPSGSNGQDTQYYTQAPTGGEEGIHSSGGFQINIPYGVFDAVAGPFVSTYFDSPSRAGRVYHGHDGTFPFVAVSNYLGAAPSSGQVRLADNSIVDGRSVGIWQRDTLNARDVHVASRGAYGDENGASACYGPAASGHGTSAWMFRFSSPTTDDIQLGVDATVGIPYIDMSQTTASDPAVDGVQLIAVSPSLLGSTVDVVGSLGSGGGKWAALSLTSADRVQIGDAATTNGVEVLAADAALAASDTALLVKVNRAGVYSVSRVTVGAANSGGAGFRQLIVPN